MDRLASMELFGSERKVCDTCGMDIKNSHGCCKDEVMIIKMEVDQKTTSSVAFELPSLDAMLQAPSQFFVASFLNVDETRHYKNHSPPLLTEQDICLDNCVFRI